jgi:hypothetical protein
MPDIYLINEEITIVDFSVTEFGLEEQILAVVVDKEHPELEKQRSDLIRVQNESTIHLKQLEDKLLSRLASSSQAQVNAIQKCGRGGLQYYPISNAYYNLIRPGSSPFSYRTSN